MEPVISSFVDRAEAGRLLARRLSDLVPEHPVIYALPRGGVPVAVEIARALEAPIDLVLVRKIGAPGAPEVALGAVVDGSDPQTVINEDIRRASRADDRFLERERNLALRELERRRQRYLGSRLPIDPSGRSVIVADDGLATGATMKAALIALKRQNAAEICVALPVAPVESLAEIAPFADRVECLIPARRFHGVGGFYADFHQLSDDETVRLLEQAWAGTDRSGPVGSGGHEE